MATFGLSLSYYGLQQGPLTLNDLLNFFKGNQNRTTEPSPIKVISHLKNNGYLEVSQLCEKTDSTLLALIDDFKNLVTPEAPIGAQLKELAFSESELTFINNHFVFYKSTYTGKNFLGLTDREYDCSAEELLTVTNILFSRISGQSKKFVELYFKDSAISVNPTANTMLRNRFLLTFNDKGKLIDFTLKSFEEMIQLELIHNPEYLALR